jgi:hypothetical protein
MAKQKAVKDKMVMVRLTAEEYEKLEREANKRDVPMAQVMRHLLKALDKEALASNPGGDLQDAKLQAPA